MKVLSVFPSNATAGDDPGRGKPDVAKRVRRGIERGNPLPVQATTAAWSLAANPASPLGSRRQFADSVLVVFSFSFQQPPLIRQLPCQRKNEKLAAQKKFVFATG